MTINTRNYETYKKIIDWHEGLECNGYEEVKVESISQDDFFDGTYDDKCEQFVKTMMDKTRCEELSFLKETIRHDGSLRKKVLCDKDFFEKFPEHDMYSNLDKYLNFMCGTEDIRAFMRPYKPILNGASENCRVLEYDAADTSFKGFYLCGNEYFTEMFLPNMYGYYAFVASRLAYGIADNATQIAKCINNPKKFSEMIGRWGQKEYVKAKRAGAKFLVLLTPVFNRHSHETGGWKWAKWGEYIGTHKPYTEYLECDDVVDCIFTFTVYTVYDISKMGLDL